MGCEAANPILTQLILVSIHTPAWGVKATTNHGRRNKSFNPHTRMGCEAREEEEEGEKLVSIHTPAWGVN